jgi:DNA-binding NarL/FixJ family response regulator
MRISVLLVDRRPVVRRGLRAMLDADPEIEIVGEAGDGVDAIDSAARLDPDVMLLDLLTPRLAAGAVLKRLGARRARTRVVVLSMHAGGSGVAEALRAGAVATLAEDASAAEIVAAIHQAAHGRRAGGGRADAYEKLTVREREVLALAARGLTSREIGRQLSISRRTAETHRANLLRKLGLKGQQDLIRYGLRRGLLEM